MSTTTVQATTPEDAGARGATNATRQETGHESTKTTSTSSTAARAARTKPTDSVVAVRDRRAMVAEAAFYKAEKRCSTRASRSWTGWRPRKKSTRCSEMDSPCRRPSTAKVCDHSPRSRCCDRRHD